MSKLGVVIVGTGWVAGEHVKAFQADSRAEVRAVCGRDAGRTKAFAEGLGLTCPTYTDLDAALKQDGIDIVSICTPPNVHKEQAVASASAGKHILLEKAMAVTVEDARAIRDAVSKVRREVGGEFRTALEPAFRHHQADRGRRDQ